jgi:hypothetical protein
MPSPQLSTTRFTNRRLFIVPPHLCRVCLGSSGLEQMRKAARFHKIACYSINTSGLGRARGIFQSPVSTNGFVALIKITNGFVMNYSLHI